ncbi:hypothetical protein MSG28_007030, partial [Choristoneura fumiferana]
MFTKKSHQDVKKSTVKIQDSKKDSATRLKHLKIVLEHIDTDEAKSYFEANFSHVYFILYDNFIQAENNLRQRVHKAGREELEGALSLLEKVLCLLPELIGKRWQLHSLTRIFSKLLHSGNSHKLRAEYFLLWYQALGDNAPIEVHKMFASLVPGLPEPFILSSGSPLKAKPYETNVAKESGDFSMEDILHHPNFSSTSDNAKKVVVEQTTGFMGKLANVSASIFHDTNALNPVQSVEVLPLLPPSANEKAIDNETRHFFEILLDGMAASVTKIQWKDRSHTKSMRCFAFLLEKFKLYYLPVICPQYNHKNSLYKPNLELPVQHNILEDDFVLCRVTLIKWVANYAHFMKKAGSDGGQPSSMTSTGSHAPPSFTPTPAISMHHEEETSFTVGQPSDSSRASSHDSASNTPHPSLDSGGLTEELNSEQVVRDVLCGWSREYVDFTAEVLRQAFLLPFAHAAAARRGATVVGVAANNIARLNQSTAKEETGVFRRILSAGVVPNVDSDVDKSEPQRGSETRVSSSESRGRGRDRRATPAPAPLPRPAAPPPPPADGRPHEETKEPASNNKPRRWYSLDSLRHTSQHEERDSASESRSPSPAPSSGVESSSIKDSPLQIDLASDGGNISANQTLNGNTEIHVPFNLVAGWCLEAEALPPTHRAGKLLALRLLCESTQAQAQGPGAPSSCNNRLHLAHLHLYQRALHHGLTGEDRSVVDVLVEYAAPRYLSLALDGYSLLLLDFVHASTVGAAAARCCGACALTAHACRLLAARQVCPRLPAHVTCLLQMLMMKNKNIAKVVSDCKIIKWICACLAQLASSSSRDSVKPLAGSLLLCLAEFAVRCGPSYLMQEKEGDQTLLLIIFKDFDPNIQLDNLGPKTTPASTIDVKLWAQTICTQLVLFLGHWPLWSSCQLSCSVGEQHDSAPPLGAELGAAVLGAPHLQLLRLSDATLASLVLAYIGHTSPEVVCGRRLDAAGPSPLPPGAEDELESVPASPFASCSLLLAQLGTLAPARRAHAQLLRRSERLLRELRNLDAQRCRETHKVAVIYVGKGQETRNEILSNRCGSPAYEAFLAALAWEVELESHVGFLGGLRVGGGGATAPYVATLTLEALEHWRAYKRDTLPTQFCDVLIALYPLPAGLLRCTLTRKPSVAVFGPLWEECLVPVECAAALVRGAAWAGGRAVRATMPLYQHAYCERARSLQAVVAHHTHPSTFETTKHDSSGSGVTGPWRGHVGRRNADGFPAAQQAPRALQAARRRAARARSRRRARLRPRPRPAPQPESVPASPFASCSLLLAQLGTLAPARRAHAQLLRRSERLLRELRNLDAQRCRETHKVAVIYVGKGQETRNEILSNRCGSPAYEAFLAALAWEVELESHVGFLGGLRVGGGGATAPYVATLTLEALFHECLVPVECAAALVRGAAWAGGRAVRATMPLYQHAYCERARSLQAVVAHHTHPSTFETTKHDSSGSGVTGPWRGHVGRRNADGFPAPQQAPRALKRPAPSRPRPLPPPRPPPPRPAPPRAATVQQQNILKMPKNIDVKTDTRLCIEITKAPDETSLQLGKIVKNVVETVGDPPACPIKLDPYISQNFMGLFVSEEHAEYLKKIAVQYVKQVHKVTQGYSPIASDELELVLGDYIYIEEKAFDSSPDGWVHGTSWLTGVSGYLPAVYTRRTAESDAWTLHRAISLGNNNSSDCKSESDSNTDGEMTSYPHEDATQLGHEKSEEVYEEWARYWQAVMVENRTDGIINITQGTSIDWKTGSHGTGDAVSTLTTVINEVTSTQGSGEVTTTHQSVEATTLGSEASHGCGEPTTQGSGSVKSVSHGGDGETVSTDGSVENSETTSAKSDRRWIFAMRHGERVDLTYGVWVPFCFDECGRYVRKDLNMPLTLGERS